VNPACPHRRTDNEHDTMGLVHVLTGRGGIRCQPKDGPLTPGDTIIPLYETEPVMTDDEQIYEDISEQVNDPEHAAQDLPDPGVATLRAEIDGQLELPFDEPVPQEQPHDPVVEPTPVPLRSFVATYSMNGSVTIEGVDLIQAGLGLIQNNPGIDLHSVYEIVSEQPVQ